MAEESINSLGTCKKSESDGSSSGQTPIRKLSSPDDECGILPLGNRISSDSCNDFNNSRRNSTGKPILQTSNQKIIPHYLRASTGSCHDFCKYGRKHAFEGKERRPFLKKIARTPSDKHNPAVNVSVDEKKKATVLKQKTSPGMISHSLKHGGEMDSANSAEIIKQKVTLPANQVVVSPKRDPLSHKKSKAVSLGERKKETMLKQMTSPDIRSHSLKHRASPGAKDSVDSPKIINQAALLPSKQVEVSPKRASLSHKSKAVPLGERKKAAVLKQMTSPDIKPHPLKHGASPGAMDSADSPEIIKKEVLLPLKQVEVSPEHDPLSPKKPKVEKRMINFTHKHASSVRPLIIKQSSCVQTLKSAKKEMVEKAEKKSNLPWKYSLSVGLLPSTKKVEKAGKPMNNLSQKSCPSVRPQRVVSKSSSLFYTLQSTNGRGKMKDETKASKNVGPTKASVKKVLATPIVSLFRKPSINRNLALKAKKNRSLRMASSLKDQNRIQKAEIKKANGEKTSEKALHVIVAETKNSITESTEDSYVVPSLAPQSFRSPKSLSHPLSSSLSYRQEGEEEEAGAEELEDYDDVDDEEQEVDDEKASVRGTTGKFISKKNRNEKNSTRKTAEGNPRKRLQNGGVFSESKDPSPVKLRFRRGRVLDLQSESNGPRRLRFHRRRVMDENHDRKSEISRRNLKKKGPDVDGNGTDPSSGKFVLRHQDMQGKKDAQGLFNNVIEETASKLVESRKSKVKALVGAFETVISLQDTKPSPQTVS